MTTNPTLDSQIGKNNFNYKELSKNNVQEIIFENICLFFNMTNLLLLETLQHLEKQ